MNSPNLEQQEKINAYIERINALELEKVTLQEQFKASERQLSQINNKSNKPVFGIAAQYKKQLSTSKFKLICYFKTDKKGNFYSISDKQQSKNRKPIPSTDYIAGRIDHETAYNKLIDYCLQNTANLDKAILIVNDYTEELEHFIFIFNPANISQSQQCLVRFKDFKGGRYFDYIDGNPLRTDKMKFYEND